MLRQDPTVMSWGLWIGTLTATSAALITAAFAALLAVLNTATSPRSKALSVPGVYFINILARKLPNEVYSLYVSLRVVVRKYRGTVNFFSLRLFFFLK